MAEHAVSLCHRPGCRLTKGPTIPASSPDGTRPAVLREWRRDISGGPRPLDTTSILALQRAAGNAAITALLGKLAATTPAPRFDAGLPAGLHARTIDGQIHLNPRVPFLPALDINRILCHEAVHSVHQRLWAPLEASDDSEESRSIAERAAVHGEQHGPPGPAQLLHPPPSVLHYTGTKIYGPWPKVWVGDLGVIGEIVEGDVPVRVFRTYAQLNVTKASEFECGSHNQAPIPDLAARMKAVGKQVAEANATIPPGAPERVSMVLLTGESSGYRTLNGIGLIELDEANFNPESAAHEAAHALFEFHSGNAPKAHRAPDTLALRFGELFTTLSKTKLVPVPTRKFDAKAGKPGATDAEQQAPAGLTMVKDVLWAGSGGHPDSPDEFFASAMGAYLHDAALLTKIIDYYEKIEPAIKGQRAELMTLLEAATDKKKQDKLKAPKDVKSATAVVGGQSKTPEFLVIWTVAGWLSEPKTMPGPDTVPSCPPPKGHKQQPPPKGHFDDVLEK